MEKFSLDDVRDSFESDVRAIVSEIGRAGRALSGSPFLKVGPEPLPDERELQALGRACHTLYGTSSLVSVKSLYETARLIQIAGYMARDCVREAARQARLATALNGLFVDGARELEAMLGLELEGKSEEAWSKALALRDRLAAWDETREIRSRTADVVAAAAEAAETPTEFSFDDMPVSGREVVRPPAVQWETHAPRSEAEFSFEDPPAPAGAPIETPAAPPTVAGADEFSFEESSSPDEGDDLRAAFQQEARESVVALQGYFDTLSANPGDADAARAVERIFHTLKGSAAVVGLIEVGKAAAGLQEGMGELVQTGGIPGPAFLADLVGRTNQLLRLAELPPIGVDRPAGPAESPELHKLFVEDAGGVLRMVATVLGRPDAGSPASLAELGRLFHRLKGSAVVSQEAEVAGRAARLQALCDARGDTAEIRRLAAELSSYVGAASDELKPEPVTIDTDPVVWEAFETEMAEHLQGMEKIILGLEQAATPKNDLQELFRGYHTMKGSVNTVGLTPLGRLLHRVEDFIEELVGAPILPPMAPLSALLLDVQEEVARNLKLARTGVVEVRAAAIDAQIAAVRGGAGAAAPAADSWDSARRSEGSGASGPPSRPAERASRSEVGDRRSVRVATARLDGLMNLAGELVVSRSRLSRRVGALRTLQRELSAGRGRLSRAVDRFREQHEFTVGRAGKAASLSVATFGELEMDAYDDANILARQLNDISHDIGQVQGRIHETVNAFSEDAAGFSGIVGHLQEEITRARMVPVEQLFSRLRLPIRDAAHRGGKRVKVEVSGEHVDLDKGIIDELYVPMLHLVRNGVAHGIETPEGRVKAGKDPVGVIRLSARQESGHIVLEASDDGAGLDLAGLHAIGRRRGLLAADVPLDHPSVAEMIFVPGVTTRGEADELSGRGVGGDVVRREIERLNGDITVSSGGGRGTRFTITLPLTLAIARALLIRHRGQTYAVGLNLAERILPLDETEVHVSAGVRRVRIGDAYHSLVALDDILSLTGEGPAGGAVVLLRVGETRLAIEVDRVLGQEEIVVKDLGDVVSGHPLFSGVTVSGDGDLILILDVLGVLQAERRRGVSRVEGPAGERTRRRVLFVDDSLSVRKVAERFLAAAELDVVLAVDGVEALERIRSDSFDLVFTDLEMPRMNGYDLLRAVRAIPSLGELPVVVVTSRTGQKHRDEAAASGASDYLTKPFTAEGLAVMVRKWARRGSGR